jgi:uncharacterized protein involved in exopolysaccharide biosynthesis
MLEGISLHEIGRFDAIEFLDYLYRQRLVFVISCGVAVLLALAVSVMLPKRYTAKSSVLIELPAGTDPRAATTLSPAYFDSLKTYESIALSDALFQRAIERLHVDASRESALKVSRAASSTLIEIYATLNDPRNAQALAQYIAEQTVQLSKGLDTKPGDDLTALLRSQTEMAQERLTMAVQARDAFAVSNPIESPQNEVRDGFQLKLSLERDLARARTDMADLAAQQNPDGERLRQQIVSAQARINAIENQRRELVRLLDKRGSELDIRKRRQSVLDVEEQTARAAYEDKRNRLNGMLTAPQFLGERLHVIDPGVVPRKASFPQTRLNVAAAFLASLVGTLTCVVFRFGYVQLRREESARHLSLR